MITPKQNNYGLEDFEVDGQVPDYAKAALSDTYDIVKVTTVYRERELRPGCAALGQFQILERITP